MNIFSSLSNKSLYLSLMLSLINNVVILEKDKM